MSACGKQAATADEEWCFVRVIVSQVQGWVVTAAVLQSTCSKCDLTDKAVGWLTVTGAMCLDDEGRCFSTCTLLYAFSLWV
jgi:hypothetical protein